MAPTRPVDTSSLHVGIRRIVKDYQLASHLEREELLFQEILMRFIICLVILAAAVIGEKAAAADPSCAFVAQGEDVDLKVLVDKQTYWEGQLRKGERQTLRVPEGAFTVQSQVYNPNMKTKETIMARKHTEQCASDRPIPVPLFTE